MILSLLLFWDSHMWISHWPWSWSCDQVFWNAKPSEIEQVLDHLTLDVTIQLRCGMKTVEKINDVNQSTQVAVVLDVTLPSPRPEIKLISPLHKIVLITCSFIFQIPSPQQVIPILWKTCLKNIWNRTYMYCWMSGFTSLYKEQPWTTILVCY